MIQRPIHDADEAFDEASAASRAYPTDPRCLAHDEAIERCASFIEREATVNYRSMREGWAMRGALLSMAHKIRTLKKIPS